MVQVSACALPPGVATLHAQRLDWVKPQLPGIFNHIIAQAAARAASSSRRYGRLIGSAAASRSNA